MARFTVYRSRADDLSLLDCQADRLSHLESRFVVPLLPLNMVANRMDRLHPIFVVDGEKLVMATHLASAVAANELGRVVATLTDEDHRIVGALDVLIGTA